MDDHAIFSAALKLENAQQRADFLARACGDNLAVRAEVEQLLAAHDSAGSFLEAPNSQHLLVRGAGDTMDSALRVRCPHCQLPVTVSTRIELCDMTCGECGSGFSLVSDTANQLAPHSLVGHFELVEQVGSGTFGAVWKARDTQLERTVAVKIPRRGQFDIDQERAFLREAQSAAQLNHPGIVPVYEVGRHGDTLFIVSDFVEGMTLADWMADQQPSIHEAVVIAAKVAAALHHAHERGVVHRDLKPGNIMLDGRLEPRLMDFGLARRETTDVHMSITGQIFGTPAYMSPEQARGEGNRADRRSDVYSLGVLLFQLLTGEVPFRGNLQRLLEQVINDEAPSPRKLNANISRDLETITLKCLEKDVTRRYQTAGHVEQELQRVLRGELIDARPVSNATRAVRLCRRNPVVSILAASVLVVLLTGAIVSGYFAVDANRQAKRALEREQDALQQKQAADAARLEEQQARLAAEQISALLVDTFRSPDARQQGHRVTVAEVLLASEQRILDEMTAQPETQAALLAAIGETKLVLGSTDSAIESLAKARELYHRAWGRGHRDSINATANLAWALLGQGHPQDAIAMYRQAIEDCPTDTLRQRHSRLWVMDCLATVYRDQAGSGPQAIELYEQILDGRIELNGPDSPETQFAVIRLAEAKIDAGQWQGELPKVQRAHDILLRERGILHEDMPFVAGELARLYVLENRPEDAVASLRRVIDACDAVQPRPASIDNARVTALRYLAEVHRDLGNLEQAVDCRRQALKTVEQIYPAGHAAVFDDLGRLATACREAGLIDEAIAAESRLQALSNTTAAE
jgi:tetratricopeptide (TPR) repeat protein